MHLFFIIKFEDYLTIAGKTHAIIVGGNCHLPNLIVMDWIGLWADIKTNKLKEGKKESHKHTYFRHTTHTKKDQLQTS